MNAATHPTPAVSERMERRIAEHKAEVARLRAELGDPREALSAFVRSHFSLEAFLPDDPSRTDARTTWQDDEADDQGAW